MKRLIEVAVIPAVARNELLVGKIVSERKSSHITYLT
jgi:hypothetical protein